MSSPSWMSNKDAPSSPSAAATNDLGPSTNSTNSNDPPFKTAVKSIITFTNFGMMVFLAATGALAINSIGSNTSSDDATGLIFVGMYILIFSAIVFTYEAIQLMPYEPIDVFYKKNFGFLYGINGKSLFILFAGILAFGLKKPQPLALACGIIVSAWGPTQILIYYKWPDYFDKKEKYQYEG